jgi:V-type H+-transporting ATPase subunit a
MYGDMGHGLILFLFGSYLCYYHNQIKNYNGMLAQVLPIRYMILLMGFFAFYAGLIYNDFFSMSINLFGKLMYYFKYIK